MAEKRRRFQNAVRRLDPYRLVFLDESGFQVRMGRSHAWVKKGQELIDRRPINWGKNLTAVGAVRLEGWVQQSTMFASMTKERFVRWFAKKLVPKLNRGDVVVMDNLSAHHDQRLEPIARAAGIKLLHLPPYSPDLNPIEPAWALQKQLVKSVAPRTPGDLRRVVKRARFRVSTRHIRGWFRFSGYQFR